MPQYHNEMPYNGPAAIQWLRDTHLQGKQVPDFQSFVLKGDDETRLTTVAVALFPGDTPMVADTPTIIPLP